MNRHALPTSGFLGPEFNAFLFELIGVDQRGRPLSVVSALARLDLDAWAEAAKLASLPRNIAADKLSAVIGKFTDVPQARQDSHKIAERLVELLPGRPLLRAQAPGQKPAPAPAQIQAQMRAQGRRAAVFILIMAALAAAQLLLAASHTPVLPQTKPASAHVLAPAGVLPK